MTKSPRKKNKKSPLFEGGGCPAHRGPGGGRFPAGDCTPHVVRRNCALFGAPCGRGRSKQSAVSSSSPHKCKHLRGPLFGCAEKKTGRARSKRKDAAAGRSSLTLLPPPPAGEGRLVPCRQSETETPTRSLTETRGAGRIDPASIPALPRSIGRQKGTAPSAVAASLALAALLHRPRPVCGQRSEPPAPRLRPAKRATRAPPATSEASRPRPVCGQRSEPPASRPGASEATPRPIEEPADLTAGGARNARG